MEKQALLSLGLTTIVGLSMGLGSIFSFFVKGENKRFLSLSLSFAAGIMIYISFMAILPEGIELLEGSLGGKGNLFAQIGFFGGMLITLIVEKFVHKFGGNYHSHNHGHHHHHKKHNHNHNSHLSNLGIISAIAISIHNLPEGLAIFTAGLKDISVAIPLAIAVMLHNIPLSIAISIPLYYSTGSRKKAFMYTLLVGLFQPLGAIIGYLLLSQFFNDFLFGILFSVVAGIMIFVSLDELLPSAQKNVDHHISVYGAIAGMIVMALSMVMFHQH